MSSAMPEGSEKDFEAMELSALLAERHEKKRKSDALWNRKQLILAEWLKGDFATGTDADKFNDTLLDESERLVNAARQLCSDGGANPVNDFISEILEREACWCIENE